MMMIIAMTHMIINIDDNDNIYDIDDFDNGNYNKSIKKK